MSVLVVGEALIDLIVSPDGSISAIPGGGPFNTARTIARLGTTVAFGGRLADDAFGRRLWSLLTADGVDLALPTLPGLLTTLALAELDPSGTATYRFYTEGTAAPAIDAGELVLPQGTTMLSVGTLGLVLEPMASATESLVAALADDVLLVVDPNCRPNVIGDVDAYRARIRRVVRRADVVKVSGDDLDYLYPNVPQASGARLLLDDGPRLVLFTDGARSVRVLASGWEVELPVPRVEVVDTVGAGDAFGGAVIAFWQRGGYGRAELADESLVCAAVEEAIVVAGITCQRIGADPPHLAEL